MTIQFGLEEIMLLPEKAFFWAEESILGLSDIHIGKAQSLQRMGLPVSIEAHADDLRTMGRLVEKHEPRDVFILGDFIHQKDSWTEPLIDELTSFFNRFKSTRWNLILGNHERGSLHSLARLPLELFDHDITRSSLTLAHGHKTEDENGANHEFRIEGHIHPVCTIREGSTRLRLPCFVASERKLLIPSFGSLTGGFEIEQREKTQIYAVTPTTVFEVKGRS